MNLGIGPDPTPEVNVTWCDLHWQRVYASMAGPEPVNGLLASVEITTAWFNRRADELGDAMPHPGAAAAMNALMDRDAPLCCWLGEISLAAVLSRCVVAPQYRGLEPSVGHRLHMAEVNEANRRAREKGTGDGSTEREPPTRR